jgi:serine/threonine-protein kinase RsbW
MAAGGRSGRVDARFAEHAPGQTRETPAPSRSRDQNKIPCECSGCCPGGGGLPTSSANARAKGRMDIRETLLIDNEPLEVSRAAEWLDGLISTAGYPSRLLAVLQVALDEVLTNIMIHGYADLETHKIEIRVAAGPASATLEFIDDGIPFDPTQHELPVVDESEKTWPGGLGILFVRRTMDEVEYERGEDRNHLILRKFISP